MKNTKRTTRQESNASDLELYEYGQALIRKQLSAIESMLIEHDRNASGKPGGHNNADVTDMQDIVGKLAEVKAMLKNVNK
jgi:hypothetical protein